MSALIWSALLVWFVLGCALTYVICRCINRSKQSWKTWRKSRERNG